MCDQRNIDGAPRPEPLSAQMRARLLGPDWAWLTGPVKDAYEQRGQLLTTVTIAFDKLPARAATGYASVLRQRSQPSGTVRASVSKIDAVLAASPLGRSSRELLEELYGPLLDRSRARAETQAQNEELWAAALNHQARQRHPGLVDWLEAERSGGKLPADISERRKLLEQSLAVLELLPAEPTLGLAQLGWRAVGDTKALTSATPLRAALLRALAALSDTAVPSSAEGRAALWAQYGATANPLVSQVLVAGFDLDGDAPVTTTLRLHARAGLAMRLTLEQVLRLAEEQPTWPDRVFIVENPEVLGATIGELGIAHPPIMCTEGRPHRAADKLVDLLVAAGTRAYAHNDFDWDGLAINGALQRRGVHPWRMRVEDLQDAAARRRHDHLPLLTGVPVPTQWQPELQPVLIQLGRKIHEEDAAVLDSLLLDLRSAARRDGTALVNP
jgi:uncharacterized protein (TIGR02679 family)